MFTRLVISAKFLRLYTCHLCGTKQQGTTEHLEVDIAGAGVPTYVLDSNTIPLKAHDMPVEWASFYGPGGRTVFRCPSCTTPKEPS